MDYFASERIIRKWFCGRHSERGLAIIEAPFAIALWIMLLFMLVNAGLLLTTYYSLNQAVRDAVAQITRMPLTPNIAVQGGGMDALYPPESNDCNVQLEETKASMQSKLDCEVRNVLVTALKGRTLWVDPQYGIRATVRTGTLVTNPMPAGGNQRIIEINIVARWGGVFRVWNYFAPPPTNPDSPFLFNANARAEFLWPPF